MAGRGLICSILDPSCLKWVIENIEDGKGERMGLVDFVWDGAQVPDTHVEYHIAVVQS